MALARQYKNRRSALDFVPHRTFTSAPKIKTSYKVPYVRAVLLSRLSPAREAKIGYIMRTFELGGSVSHGELN